MQRLTRAPSLLHRIKPSVTTLVRFSWSTPAVPEQLQYVDEMEYMDVLEFTGAENEFGNYFKECLEEEGLSYQSLETASYQMMMDERDFDTAAGPRPDSPAWAYMYGNNLVDFKAQMENLTADKEYKRGFYKHRVEALEKKLRMHFPHLDWQSRYERRLKQWENETKMSAFARCKAEALAKAVAENPDGYIDLYRSNSHYNFGPDDPFHYYMPKENEEKWLNLQRFEWDQTSRNADRGPYMEALNKLEAMVEPAMNGVPFQEAMKRMLGSTETMSSAVALFKKAVPSTIEGAEGLTAQAASASKSVESTPPGRLLVSLVWGNMPDILAQFFVRPGSLDSFISDNQGTLTDIACSLSAMAKSAAALDKAVTAACAAVEKSCNAKGLAAFLEAEGLAAAAVVAVPAPEPNGLSQQLTAVGNALKTNSFLGYVNCIAAANVLQSENVVTNLYNSITFGPRGALIETLSQAKGTTLAKAIGAQAASFTGNAGDAAVAAEVFDVQAAVTAANEARVAHNQNLQRIKVDYALADLASLEVQYKF